MHITMGKVFLLLAGNMCLISRVISCCLQEVKCVQRDRCSCSTVCLYVFMAATVVFLVLSPDFDLTFGQCSVAGLT